MKKTFLKDLLTFGIIVALWAVYSMGYLPMGQAMDVLTIVVFVTIMTLAAEDAATKVIKHKELITWQYVVLMAFVMACDFLWVFLGVCATMAQLASRAILLCAAVGGTVVWAAYAYRISVMSEDERIILTKSILYKKLSRKFRKMNDEEVEKALSKALFCHLKDDSLEGGLLVGEPFTVERSTLDELLQQDSGTDNGAAIQVISGYIQQLIATRPVVEKKAKKTKKEKN